ncbi:TetR/AcrR family transcriptional regulator [Anaerovorax odorimutans]|uniref:TetR/AcrR family transcriptional regulator n=1 Tax=Anaerovorax odorimutans TaxID=109327 RepID=UPI000414BCA1|nr:TetR/AcrR family transcriptional regulator [Anaerovorax odorimutans]
MSQVLKEDIKEKIILSAKEEFYKRDYNSAKLRDIAKNADISLGLIYSYFKNKEELFNAILSPVFLKMKILLNKSREENDISFNDFIDEELKMLLYLLKNYREELVILIDKSNGTKYEKAKEEIINMTQNHIKKQLEGKKEKRIDEMDDLFYHILASNFMEGIFEIARHYKNDDWSVKIMNLLYKQYFYGTTSFI